MQHPFETWRQSQDPIPSQSEVARRMGITPPTYSGIIHGRYQAGQRVLKRADEVSGSAIDLAAVVHWRPPRRRRPTKPSARASA